MLSVTTFSFILLAIAGLTALWTEGSVLIFKGK